MFVCRHFRKAFQTKIEFTLSQDFLEGSSLSFANKKYLKEILTRRPVVVVCDYNKGVNSTCHYIAGFWYGSYDHATAGLSLVWLDK